MADVLVYRLQALTGGASNALDGIDGNSLAGGELAFIHTSTKLLYIYQLNATSGQSESVPAIIAPDLNAGNKRWELLAAMNQSVLLPDTDNSHNLILQSGENLSADRILSIILGDAARSITLSGNPTLGDWFDQAVKAASSPTFGNITDSGLTASLPVFSDANKKLVSKSIADTLTALGLTSALVYKGVIDCSANPNYPAADAGHMYIVSVAGKIGGASGITVDIGDSLICKTDASASGDQATVGANWNVVQSNILIDTDGTLAADSDAKIPSQKAVKTYSDTKAPKASPVFTGDATIPTINLTGGQIKFPATQSASSDANTLDDYEEGTWEPSFTCGTPGDLSVSYGTRTGTYTKIGRVVTASFMIAATITWTTSSGIVSLSGLPFTVNGGAFTAVGAYGGYTSANFPYIGAQLSSTTSIYLFKSGSGQTAVNIPIADFPTGGTVVVYGTVSYFV